MDSRKEITVELWRTFGLRMGRITVWKQLRRGFVKTPGSDMTTLGTINTNPTDGV